MLLTVSFNVSVLQDVVFRAGRCITCYPKRTLITNRRLSISPHTMTSPSNCIFCQICGDNPSGTEIISSTEDVVVFRDIKPAAKHHYLIVTKEHVPDAKALKPEQRPLLQKMVDTAERVLREQNADMSDIRLGFHWPPFHSVSHLHLHAISPTSDMGLMARMIFKPNSWWFVSPEYVFSRL